MSMQRQRPRPGRLAGLVLIGVAVVAAGLGVFALTSNGTTPQSAGRPPVTGTTTPATKPVTPPPGRTTSTKPPGTTTSPPPGTSTTVAPPPTTGNKPIEQTVPVRVYNNSMIKDLATNAANDFKAAGFDVVQVGNYPGGIIPASTVYYTSLPGEQQVATELARDFNMKVAPRFPGIAFASPGVIVIVTDNFQAGK